MMKDKQLLPLALTVLTLTRINNIHIEYWGAWENLVPGLQILAKNWVQRWHTQVVSDSERLRLEGTSWDHLVQPPAQAEVLWPFH